MTTWSTLVGVPGNDGSRSSRHDLDANSIDRRPVVDRLGGRLEYRFRPLARRFRPLLVTLENATLAERGTEWRDDGQQGDVGVGKRLEGVRECLASRGRASVGTRT